MRIPLLNKCYITTILCIFGSAASAAVPAHGVNFTHKDWQLVCDNTNTCRAAGATTNVLALMITRNAGVNQLPSAKLRFTDYDKYSLKRTLVGGIQKVMLRVDNKIVGRLTYDAYGNYLLDELQTASAIDALKGKESVSFEVIDHSEVSKTVTLSGQGAYAIFLKMDEIQERIGTSAALIKKGVKDENQVLRPVDVPVVHRVIPNRYRRVEARELLTPKALTGLTSKLVDSLERAQDCHPLQTLNKPIFVQSLNKTHVLLSMICQGSPAYFESDHSDDYRVGYWTMDNQFLGGASLVTIDATDYGNGLISASRRSDVDCQEYKSWIWDGFKFVLGNSYIQGMCHKKISYLAQWKMPTIVVNEIIPE